VPDDGDIFWPSPFGEGRPGWHIECSAMSMKVLGESFDLHLGGEDLKFPHHEDEIAQSEGATGSKPGEKRFVKHWLHGAHLLVEGKKMSKSLGNYFTLRDLQAKGFTGREVRYLLLTAHYRETYNFTLEGLAGAKTALARIDECIGKLRELASGQVAQVSPDSFLVSQFSRALEKDLNISSAWAAVFNWVTTMNNWCSEMQKKELELSEPAFTWAARNEAAAYVAEWEKVDSVLGIGVKTEVEIPPDISALAEARVAAKKAKDFKRGDEIRGELKSKGWVIEDTPKGIKLKKL
jgi:cysteinyl-tRNA synthetase